MTPEQRQQILDRAAKRKQALADAQPPPDATAAEPAATAQVVRTSGGVQVRVVDENNPPTQAQTRRQPVTARTADAPATARRPLGARIVTPTKPGPKIRQTPTQGAYGARVVPSEQPAAPTASRTPAPPAPSFQTMLRTPLQPGAPAVPPAAVAAAPPPQPTGGAPQSPTLQAQIEALGHQQGAASRGTPGTPVVTPVAVGYAPAAPPVAGEPVAAAVSVGDDITAILSQHLRPDTLDNQYRALRAAGVTDHSMWCWVNPGGTKLNDGLIGRLRRFGSNHDVGPWFRWSLTSLVPTKYTLMIDDDCTPGPQWLQLALQRIEAAEVQGQRVVVSAAGQIYQVDAVDSTVPIGPESLHRQEVEVDLGRGAWLMHTDLARAVLAYPQVGSPLATALHVAAALQDARASMVVLPYIHNHREGWGMLESPQPNGSLSQRFDREAQQSPGHPSAAALRGGDYDAYRHAAGWQPMCVVEAVALAAVAAEEAAANAAAAAAASNKAFVAATAKEEAAAVPPAASVPDSSSEPTKTTEATP